MNMRGSLVALLFAGSLFAQSEASSSKPAAAPPVADVNQLMRGLFFPNSNVVFLTQREDPATIKPVREPSTATDPLTSVFGGWEAVENSALTIADSADLLLTPGRKCTNGREMPIAKEDWVKYVKDLREAGIFAFKAAKTKDKDKMIEASDVLATSCSNCHNKYRLRAANRCQ